MENGSTLKGTFLQFVSAIVPTPGGIAQAYASPRSVSCQIGYITFPRLEAIASTTFLLGV